MAGVLRYQGVHWICEHPQRLSIRGRTKTVPDEHPKAILPRDDPFAVGCTWNRVGDLVTQ